MSTQKLSHVRLYCAPEATPDAGRWKADFYAYHPATGVRIVETSATYDTEAELTAWLEANYPDLRIEAPALAEPVEEPKPASKGAAKGGKAKR